jgi:antitoxin VapB
MAINIKDPETDQLVRRLASLTGETITDAVRTAAQERIEREERARGKASLEELMAIAHRIASAPDRDPRTPEEIIGYDERGLPR